MGWKHLGSRWFQHVDKPFKLRQWKDHQIDMYRVFHDDEEPLLVFRGYLPELEKIAWVFDRISI